MVFHYLATPYTRYPHGMEAAYREARKCAAMLTDTGVIVFAPVV